MKSAGAEWESPPLLESPRPSDLYPRFSSTKPEAASQDRMHGEPAKLQVQPWAALDKGNTISNGDRGAGGPLAPSRTRLQAPEAGSGRLHPYLIL